MTSPAPPGFDRPFADMRPFLEFVRDLGFDPSFVVDVGANRGRWTETAKEVFPRAEFLLVEPQPEMRAPLDELCARLDGVRWLEVAAGAREETRLQTIWEDLEGSSFRPSPDPERLARGTQRPAPVRRLDDLLAEAGGRLPDLVKLDIQGFELEALEGASSLFGHTELFVLETSLYRFLEGLPLVREVTDFLAERGYEIYDVAGYIRRPSDGALGQLDLAFAKSRGFLRRDDRW